jgi:predicted ATPase
MKDARFSDYQRRLKTKPLAWPTRLHRFAYSDVPTLGTGEFLVQSPVTAICGPNGVGKTTLLRALWRTLDPEAADESIAAKKLLAGSTALTLTFNERTVVNEVEFTQQGTKPIAAHPVTSVFIDSAAESGRYQAQFSGFESVEDIINGEGGRDLDQKSIQEISFITNRDYRDIKLYEIDLGRTVPFFEVAYGDDRYDSRTMGSGEIAAFHLWWAIGTLSAGQVALIEEPEAFLSHACQVHLSKHIVAQAVERRFCVVASTHSSPFMSLLPEDSLKFFTRDRQGICAVPERVPPALMKSVGIDPPFLVFALVEDDAAAYFARALLERSAPSFARQVRTIVCGGEGGITNALRSMLFYSGLPLFVGLYDGDMRGTTPDVAGQQTAFLPGEQRIELVFRKMLAEDPTPLRDALARDDLNVILTSLEGADDHDWFRRLGEETGLSRTQLFPTLFSIWFKKEGNAEAATQTYEELRRIAENCRQL